MFLFIHIFLKLTFFGCFCDYFATHGSYGDGGLLWNFAGHDSHGVHVCHKCGWPFPKPYPSAKHRRAHKKICGTIKGNKLVDSESSAHLTVSDDEHLSDEDRKTRGENCHSCTIIIIIFVPFCFFSLFFFFLGLG